MNRTTTRLGSLCFMLVACVGASAQEWAQWRGANRDGVARSFAAPKVWPKALTKKWKVPAGGGYSSPVVAAGRVFLHTREGEQEVVTAFDLGDGKTVWRKSYDAAFDKNQYAVKMGKGPNSTPAVYEGRLYTLGVNAVLSAFDAKTGALVWRKDFGRPDTSKLFCGTAMSPVIEKGKVIVHVGDDRGGKLSAFDARTGAEVWTWAGDGPGYASPVVAELAGARQIVTLTDKSVVGVAADTGKLLWKLPFADEWNENIVTPVVYNKNTLVVSGVRQGTKAIEVTKTAEGFAARQLWHNPQVAMYMSSPVLDGDQLYGMSSLRKGQFFCLDAKTGALLWATEGREGAQAAALSTGDALLFLTADGSLLVINKSAKAFEKLAQYPVADSATYAHPALVGRQILIKDEASLALWSVD